MRTAFVKVPAQTPAGELVTAKVLIRHRMESGHRRDRVGKRIARNIINHFVARYDGAEVFRMELFPGIAANPFLEFRFVATVTGELSCEWTDDDGQDYRKSVTVNVT